MWQWIVRTSSEEETREVGRALAQGLGPGSLVGITGPLGAGKTRLVQGIAAGLGVPEEVPVTSPTYTYLNVYHGRLPVYHMDLYRLTSLDDMEEIGYRDFYFSDDGVCAVEWFERVPDAIPNDHLLVTMEVISDQEREIRLVAGCGHGEEAIHWLATHGVGQPACHSD